MKPQTPKSALSKPQSAKRVASSAHLASPIEQLAKKQKQQAQDDEDEEVVDTNVPKYFDNLDKLQKIKSHGEGLVVSVKIETDQQENERRLQQEMKQEALQQKLINESVASTKRQAALSMKWPAIFAKVIPQEINEDIITQLETCKKVLDSKNRIIQELDAELRSKDDEYVKALKKQSKDVDILITRMHQQYIELLKSYDSELGSIEVLFLALRKETLEAHGKELDKNYEQRREDEKKYIDQRLKKVQENEQELNNMRDEQLEKFASTKKGL